MKNRVLLTYHWIFLRGNFRGIFPCFLGVNCRWDKRSKWIHLVCQVKYSFPSFSNSHNASNTSSNGSSKAFAICNKCIPTARCISSSLYFIQSTVDAIQVLYYLVKLCFNGLNFIHNIIFSQDNPQSLSITHR